MKKEQHYYDEDEEALSLRDLPLTSPPPPTSPPRGSFSTVDDHHHLSLTPNHSRQSSSSSFSSNSHHDDGFSFEFPVTPTKTISTSPTSFFPRRSLSLSSTTTTTTRKLTRNSTLNPSLLSSSSSKSRKNNAKYQNDDVIKKGLVPWYKLLVGPMRVPVEMELKEIKTRQCRHRSLSAASSSSSLSSPSWRIIGALSCKSHASVDAVNSVPFRRRSLSHAMREKYIA